MVWLGWRDFHSSLSSARRQLPAQRSESIKSSWMLGWLQLLSSLRFFSGLTVIVRHFLYSLFLELFCCSQGSGFLLTTQINPCCLPWLLWPVDGGNGSNYFCSDLISCSFPISAYRWGKLHINVPLKSSFNIDFGSDFYLKRGLGGLVLGK